ncbi:unnamed protein product [Meloidogyne enterolobii]|uniref:Uncharacterized protein n=1 Tax=Meloidogyne enterolobii TaxID=390850 RepID=A0ACB1AVK1_MELEN
MVIWSFPKIGGRFAFNWVLNLLIEWSMKISLGSRFHMVVVLFMKEFEVLLVLCETWII